MGELPRQRFGNDQQQPRSVGQPADTADPTVGRVEIAAAAAVDWKKDDGRPPALALIARGRRHDLAVRGPVRRDEQEREWGLSRCQNPLSAPSRIGNDDVSLAAGAPHEHELDVHRVRN